MNAKIIEGNWITCGRCGHKLAKVIGAGMCDPSPIIEFKCHSCKKINVWAYDYWRKENSNDKR